MPSVIMLFKSFSHISRHAAIAKTLWASYGNTSQPAFFATTNQLARQQSQLVPRNNCTFNHQSEQSNNSSTNPNGYSALCNSSSFSSLSPLSTLDDDKRREAILAESTGSGGAYLIHNHQHSLSAKSPVADSSTKRRRYSASSIDEYKPQSLRRYSTSRKPDFKITQPQTSHSSPVADPVNTHSDTHSDIDPLIKTEPTSLLSKQLKHSLLMTLLFLALRHLLILLFVPSAQRKNIISLLNKLFLANYQQQSTLGCSPMFFKLSNFFNQTMLFLQSPTMNQRLASSLPQF